MQLLSKAVAVMAELAQKEVCPRDEIADPPGTAVRPIGRHGFAEGFVSFRTLCGIQSSLVRFARIKRLPGVRYSSVAGTVRDSVFKPYNILS